jgi:hypothetical protein
MLVKGKKLTMPSDVSIQKSKKHGAFTTFNIEKIVLILNFAHDDYHSPHPHEALESEKWRH